MRLVSEELQKAYYTALSDQISVYAQFLRDVSNNSGTTASTTHVQGVVDDLDAFFTKLTIFSPCSAGKAGTLYAGGSSTLSNDVIGVYDVVPPDTDYPYVVLTGQNVIETNFNTDKRITEIVTDVDVVTGYDGSFGGKRQMFEISDQVINIIRQVPGSYLSLQGFTMLTSTLDSTVSIQEQSETNVLFINRLRFRHKIQEN